MIRATQPTYVVFDVLELKRYKTHKGAAYKCQAKTSLAKVLRAVETAETTLKVKNLNEVTDAEELVTALSATVRSTDGLAKEQSD